MARDSLNLTELFEKDNSRGSLLVELLQKRKGMMPKINLFMMPQENDCSFDIQLERISTGQSNVQQQLSSHDERNKKNAAMPCKNNLINIEMVQSTKEKQIPLKDDGNGTTQHVPISSGTEMPLLAVAETNKDDNQNNQSNAQYVEQPPNNNNENNHNLPTLQPTQVSKRERYKTTINYASSNDLLRRISLRRLRRSHPAQKVLMEEVNNLEKTEGNIEFNPVACSTPYHKEVLSPMLTRSESNVLTNRESNISNLEDINRIEEELRNALDEITQDKTTHCKKHNDADASLHPSAASVRQVLNENDLENNNNMHKASCVTNVDEDQQQNSKANEGEHEVEDRNNKNDKTSEGGGLQDPVKDLVNPPSENNLQLHIMSQDSSIEIVIPKLNVQSKNRFEKEQSHVLNNKEFKALENSQVPLNLRNHKANTINQKNSINTEVLAVQAIHMPENMRIAHDSHEKIRKLTLNKAPGVPLNGEVYAKELTQLTNYEILDLRKRNSIGEIFKVKKAGKSSSRAKQLREIKRKQQELEQLINFELLKRDLTRDENMEWQQLQQEHHHHQQQQQEQQQQQQQQQQQSQGVNELEQQPQVEAQREPEPQLEINPTPFEEVEPQLSKMIGSDICDDEYLTAPSPFRDKTVQPECKKSFVKNSTSRKSNMSTKSSNGNVSVALQHYMEVPKRIMERKKNSTRHSKRSLYNTDNNNIDNSTLEPSCKEQENLCNKSVRSQNSNDEELDAELDDVTEKGTPLLQVLAPPSFYKDTLKETGTSSSPRDDEVFKKPIGLPPKRGRPPTKEKSKSMESNCSTELRRSNRTITCNKRVQFVQQLYEQVMEKHMKQKASANKNTLRRTPASMSRSSTLSSNNIGKISVLPSVQEEDNNEFMAPSGSKQNNVEPVKSLKEHPRKEATKIKGKKKKTTIQAHETKGNNRKKQSADIYLSGATNISNFLKKGETSHDSVLPVISDVNSQNNNENVKRTRRKTYTRKRKQTNLPLENDISGQSKVAKSSKKARATSPPSHSASPLLSSATLPPSALSRGASKPVNVEPKEKLKRGRSKRQTTKQATEPLPSKGTKLAETTERNDNEEMFPSTSNKQMNGNLKKSRGKSNLKNKVIKQSSSECISNAHNEIVKSSEQIDPVLSTTRNKLNEEEHLNTKVTKQKRRPIKTRRKPPAQKQKAKVAIPDNNNENSEIQEEQLQMKHPNQLETEECSMQNKGDVDLDYSRIILPTPPPVHHLNTVFDGFNGTETLPKSTYPVSGAATPIANHQNSVSTIPARCRDFKVKIKKLTKLPENCTQNTLGTTNSDNDNYSLQHQAQQVTSSSDPNIELITWLKTVQETEILGPNKEIFEEMRISSHANLYFTKLQGIEYAFYNTDETASLGYLRFMPRQIKSRRRAKHYHLHFVTIVGTFRFTANNRNKVLTVGDMVAIQKMVHYEIENLTDDIGILMVIKK